MVFSEGDCLNIALTFFDDGDPTYKKEGIEACEEPRIEHSDIVKDFDVYKYVGRDEQLPVIVMHDSENNVFLSGNVRHRYPGQIEEKYKTVQQFIDDHNVNEYLMQGNTNTEGCYLWMNWGSVHSQLHYDAADNWIHQIQGRKRVVMFPPDDRELLYVWNSLPVEMVHIVSANLYNISD